MPAPSCLDARLGRALVLAAALMAGGAPGAPAPAAEPLAPRAVIGHAAADGTGATQRWTLPPEAPFLLVPEVGPEIGAIATLESGAEVGVALFQKPYFQSKDLGCTPDLGTDARPDLKWLGATARFMPGVPGQSADLAARPEPAAGGYTSLIIYDRSLGPPPGALLLDRRRTLGTACPKAIHKIFYNRLFVPIAPAPEAARCFDLAGLHPGGKGADILLSFKTSDRVALLTPGDLDGGYAGQAHRFTVTLFDEIGCRGTPLGLKSGATLGGVVRLDDYGFRNRARSLRLVYEGGALSPYLTAPPPAQPVAALQAPAQDDVLSALESATRQPPVTTAAGPPAPRAADVDLLGEPRTTPTIRATLATAAGPLPADQTATNPSTGKLSDTTQSATYSATSAAPDSDQSATQDATQDATRAGLAVAAADDSGTPSGDLPKLQPNLEPEARAAAASQTFAYPVYDIYRLNYCLRWGSDCGAPAADAWCRAKGFGGAADFAVDKNIGAVFPTIVLGEERVCAQFVCDGFAEITCTP
jgi:hypothetical protein